jgi:hypothetical protein
MIRKPVAIKFFESDILTLMKAKSFTIMSLVVALSLSACSSTPSAEELAKEQQIAVLKASVCEITKATGNDSVSFRDLADFYNNGIGPNDKNDPVAAANYYVVSGKFLDDVEKLEALVGKWTDSDGKGYLKFCNS